MSLQSASFPSSPIFDTLSTLLSDVPTRRAAITKSGPAIYAITLRNSDKEEESWYIDLSEEGNVGKGVAPEGKKAAVTLVLADKDFGDLVRGKANAQRLFMAGRLKVRGDVMRATKLEGLFKLVQGRGGAKL